jgi:hypothetical protein
MAWHVIRLVINQGDRCCLDPYLLFKKPSGLLFKKPSRTDLLFKRTVRFGSVATEMFDVPEEENPLQVLTYVLTIDRP